MAGMEEFIDDSLYEGEGELELAQPPPAAPAPALPAPGARPPQDQQDIDQYFAPGGEPQMLAPPAAQHALAPGAVPFMMPVPAMTPMAVGQTQGSSGGALGLSLLCVAAGGAIGAYAAGLPGLAAGALGAGAAVNTVRAFRQYSLGTEGGDKEGLVSAFYAIVGAIGGGVIYYRYGGSRDRLRANPEYSECDANGVFGGPGPCSIRRVGP